jgi:hypothetical protein
MTKAAAVLTETYSGKTYKTAHVQLRRPDLEPIEG